MFLVSSMSTTCHDYLVINFSRGCKLRSSLQLCNFFNLSLTLLGPDQWRTQEFCSGGVQQIQLRTEDRENGDLGDGSPLVRGSGGSCNLVQEISFHTLNFLNFWYFSLFMMTTSLVVIANVKQLRTG